jgi:hypothetical protein
MAETRWIRALELFVSVVLLTRSYPTLRLVRQFHVLMDNASRAPSDTSDPPSDTSDSHSDTSDPPSDTSDPPSDTSDESEDASTDMVSNTDAREQEARDKEFLETYNRCMEHGVRRSMGMQCVWF